MSYSPMQPRELRFRRTTPGDVATEMSIFSGHDEPEQVHWDSATQHGLLQRPTVSFNGQFGASGGYPAPIIRGRSFTTQLHWGPAPYGFPVANVVTGVPTKPYVPRVRSRQR